MTFFWLCKLPDDGPDLNVIEGVILRKCDTGRRQLYAGRLAEWRIDVGAFDENDTPLIRHWVWRYVRESSCWFLHDSIPDPNVSNMPESGDFHTLGCAFVTQVSVRRAVVMTACIWRMARQPQVMKLLPLHLSSSGIDPPISYLPKIVFGITRWWAYGNEAGDARSRCARLEAENRILR